MVTRYGFSSKIGPIAYGDDDDEVFIGRDLAHAKSYAESTQAGIDAEVHKIISSAYDKAREILTANMDVLHRCADLLIKQEKIHREEFEALFAKHYSQPEEGGVTVEEM